MLDAISGMSRIRRCTLRTAGRAKSLSFGRLKFSLTIPIACIVCFDVLFVAQTECRAEATNASVAAVAKPEDTNNLETLRAYLQLQEQLHLTQLAIEENRKEARDAASQSAQVLTERLQSIEKALSAQRARELEAMQSSNRVMLTVAGTFAAVGFVAMLLMAYFQWRTVHGLAEISAPITKRSLDPGPTLAALAQGDPQVLTSAPVPEVNRRLLGTLERLEERIHELEHTPHPALNAGVPSGDQSALSENGHPTSAASQGGPSNRGEAAGPEGADHLRVLLGKGQSMLNLDKAEAALTCFEEALALEPSNAEALIKKGVALERLQKLDQAIECFDRAISVDGSMTIAYLHKGGLFNRMERFNEALECYEQALRTQERRHD
jgi:tetratricopeptide (TPR) repeat protein